jgi:hypothetical protein
MWHSYLLLVWLVFGIFIMVRYEFAYRCRMAFIDDASLYPKAYGHLPGYDRMVINPRHWHRWTKRQWVEYVERLDRPEERSETRNDPDAEGE